jgi:hypothetical protein
MSRYALIIYAEDGRFVRGVYNTREQARAARIEFVGHDSEVDDWGRRAVIDPMPETVQDKHTANALLDAFDARECGTLTPEQDKLLSDHNF